MASEDLSFWQHIDVLRAAIIRCIVAVMGCGVVAFCLKEPLFKWLFWPTESGFPLWQLFPLEDGFRIDVINTQLAQQFIVHVEVAMLAALIAVVPYILVEAVRFVAPALYPNERRAVLPVVVAGYLMFMLGAALSYLVIFPLTLRFLADYHVVADIPNLIALDSYVSSFFLMLFMMGLVFELPVVCSILARLGLLTPAPMRHYRKHAIVAILILSAVITPTGDAFTLAVVSIPIWLLYESAILIVRLHS